MASQRVVSALVRIRQRRDAGEDEGSGTFAEGPGKPALRRGYWSKGGKRRGRKSQAYI